MKLSEAYLSKLQFGSIPKTTSTIKRYGEYCSLEAIQRHGGPNAKAQATKRLEAMAEEDQLDTTQSHP